MNSFNVIADPWIPVLKDDMTSLYSVRDVLKYAPDIKCIVSPGSLPSEEYAIYRFLFALLTDAYQIENDDLQECVEEMHQIIQGEHRRSFRNAEFIEHMKEELKGE